MLRAVIFSIIAVIVTTVALWFFLTPEVIQALQTLTGHIQWSFIGIAFVLSSFVQWLRAWRFSILMFENKKWPPGSLIRIALQLNMYNFLLPFRLGEISFPLLMKKKFGTSLAHSTGVILIVRIFDLFVVGSILLLTASLTNILPFVAPWVLWLASALSLSMPFIFMAIGHIVARLFLKLGIWTSIAQRLISGLDALNIPQIRWLNVGISLLIWLIFGSLAIFTTQAVTDSIPPLVSMLGASAGNLAFALPISGVAGLGPSQAAWIGAVTQAQIPWDIAIVTALVLHMVVLGNSILCGLGAILWDLWKRPAPSTLEVLE